ncbi:tyrosine-type recombinase/integrase [Sphingobium nicotianae]|uniref:Tyrosine-type recombinase/integrase n=1 Tax=Sphingobium nicotianae TaxID=2782607 RepID=A0A9X1IPJ6_9SPHN|nr:site-specific integrase [Sphingobium nicotianae]MBT2186104.1 tyrosine-type recombinase/integrase [Sphingobium nicotianae]
MSKLTAISVRTAKPGRHVDGKGLSLFVAPTGGRSWVLRVQVAGRRRDIGLGTADVSSKQERRRDGETEESVPLLEQRLLTLAEAREKAALLRKLAKAGRDPVAERDKERIVRPSFAEAVIKAHAEFKDGWSEKEADAFLASLKEHANPTLGKKRVDHIEASDVAEALKPIWTAKPFMGRKVRRRIAKVLNYARAKKWRSSEAPNEELSILLGKHRTKNTNFPAMPYVDTPAYYQRLGSNNETMGRLALMFVIATAARGGEVRNARWSQIDLKKRLWNRPAEIMKGDVAHSITLNDAALGVLERAEAYRKEGENDPLVFPSAARKVISDMTVLKVLRDAKLPFVPHGFRSSFRDWAAEKVPEIPDPVAEAALAHGVPDKVVAAYKRTTFLEMRRNLLDKWGAYLLTPPAAERAA